MAGILMSCVKPILGYLFSFIKNPVVEQLHSLVSLEETGNTLITEMENLKNTRGDLERDVSAQERHRVKRSNQVKRWLESVDSIDEKVDKFHRSFARRTTCLESCCSPDNCWSYYKLCRTAAELLREVQDLKTQGKFSILVSPEPPKTVEEIPISSSLIIGGEETLRSIRTHLRNERISMVGIHGMRGAGKTTLLTTINNEILVSGTDEFDLVIWVHVSKDPNISRIQEDISVRLGYFRNGQEGRCLPEGEEKRAQILFRALSQKKFLLLFDDLWERLDLEKIGVPIPTKKNRCKVAFTTRFQEVCVDMDAEEVEVELLNERTSWELFYRTIGGKVDLQSQLIQPLAQSLIEKCSGLPLFLISVGQSMASAKTSGEWEDAIIDFEELIKEVNAQSPLTLNMV